MAVRMQPWQEILGLTLMLAALLALYWKLPTNEIVFLDRPREAADDDFLIQYLHATQTPYQFEAGYLALAAGPETRRRLIRLSLLLEQAIAGCANEKGSTSGKTPRPTADGRIEWRPLPAGASQEEVRAKLGALHAVTARALEQLGGVGVRLEPVLRSRTGVLTGQGNRSGPEAAAIRPAESEEIIELSEIELDHAER